MKDYKELVEEAQKINKEYWVKTGNNLPQINAMFEALLIKINELEKRLEALENVGSNYVYAPML